MSNEDTQKNNVVVVFNITVTKRLLILKAWCDWAFKITRGHFLGMTALLCLLLLPLCFSLSASSHEQPFSFAIQLFPSPSPSVFCQLFNSHLLTLLPFVLEPGLI